MENIYNLMKNLNKKTWQKYKKEVYYIISNKEREKFWRC